MATNGSDDGVNPQGEGAPRRPEFQSDGKASIQLNTCQDALRREALRIVKTRVHDPRSCAVAAEDALLRVGRDSHEDSASLLRSLRGTARRVACEYARRERLISCASASLDERPAETVGQLDSLPTVYDAWSPQSAEERLVVEQERAERRINLREVLSAAPIAVLEVLVSELRRLRRREPANASHRSRVHRSVRRLRCLWEGSSSGAGCVTPADESPDRLHLMRELEAALLGPVVWTTQERSGARPTARQSAHGRSG